MHRGVAFWSLGLLAAMSLGFSLTERQEPLTPDPKLARVSGRILDKRDKPIQGAKVSIFGPLHARKTVESDKLGAYSFEIVPGTYEIQVTARGYAPASCFCHERPSRAPMKVSAGQILPGIDFTLEPGGGISGRVLHQDEMPVTGTTVRTYHMGASSWEEARMDAEGRYSISDLTAGRHIIRVDIPRPIPGFRNKRSEPVTTYTTWYFPGVLAVEEATEVAVVAGVETPGVDFKIGPSDVKGAIRGVVKLQESGRPVPEVEVWVYPRPDPTIQYLSMSDKKGAYEFKDLPSGRYGIYLVGDALKGRALPEHTVEIDREPVEVDLVMEKAASVSGRIVVDESDTLFDGQVSMCEVQHGSIVGAKQASTEVVDGEVRFRVNSLLPGGNYLFGLAYEKDRTPLYVRSVTRKEMDLTTRWVNVKPGDRVEDLVLVLSNAGGSVHCSILEGQGGRAVHDDLFYLLPYDFDESLVAWSFSRFESGGPDGRCEFKAVRPGRYYVTAIAGTLPLRNSEGVRPYLISRKSGMSYLEVKPRETKEVAIKYLSVNGQ